MYKSFKFCLFLSAYILAILKTAFSELVEVIDQQAFQDQNIRDGGKSNIV